MKNLAKECIKLGRKSAHSTMDFTEVFGAHLLLNGVVDANDKDHVIMCMANTIMKLTSRGKFNLKDF